MFVTSGVISAKPKYIVWATLFGQLKNWPVKLASYFMPMRFEVIDLKF